MAGYDGFMRLLDLRSFSSVWYWLALLSAWTIVGRGMLGVPGEVLHRARVALRAAGEAAGGTGVEPGDKAADDAGDKTRNDAGGGTGAVPVEGLLLLDWLSLTLPRWRVAPTDGAILAAVGAFILTSLVVLGFGYGLELAQAMVLLAAPLAVLLLMRVRLAQRLRPLLDDAHAGRITAARAADAAAAAMTRHRLQAVVLSMLAVAAAAVRGTWWVIMHPYGF